MRGILLIGHCQGKRHQAIGVKSVGALWAIAPIFQPLETPKFVFPGVGSPASSYLDFPGAGRRTALKALVHMLQGIGIQKVPNRFLVGGHLFRRLDQRHIRVQQAVDYTGIA